MDTTLYLTTAEQELLNNIDVTLTENFSVEAETFGMYETIKQLQMRHFLADFTAYPEINTLIEKLKSNPTDITKEDLETMNPEFQEEVYFAIGARGVDVFVQELIKNISDEDDMEALCFLTTVRHKLLDINSKSKHV